MSLQAPPLSLSSSESKLHFIAFVYICTSFYRHIVARYGGSRPEEDQALGISSIRPGNVRLVDEKQSMVIVSPDADPPVVRIMDSDLALAGGMFIIR